MVVNERVKKCISIYTLSLVRGKMWEYFPIHLKGRRNVSVWTYLALG